MTFCNNFALWLLCHLSNQPTTADPQTRVAETSPVTLVTGVVSVNSGQVEKVRDLGVNLKTTHY